MKRQSNLGYAAREAAKILSETRAQWEPIQQLLADPETRISDETEQAIHDAAAALAQQGKAVTRNQKRKYKATRFRLSTPVRKKK